MKKFSKIFENRDELLLKLGASEEEVRDICSELIDEGYKLSMSSMYIGLNGHIYKDPNETSKYYPSIEIDLYRDLISDKDTGEHFEKYNDVRNWNGGVYFEGNINILKTIYEICYRFESTFKSDKAEVFFSIRSINEINVRITFDIEYSISPIDFEEVKKYIIKNNIDDLTSGLDYRIKDRNWSGNKMSTTIKLCTSDSGKYYPEDIHRIGDFKDIRTPSLKYLNIKLKTHDMTNLLDLKKLSLEYSEYIYDFCKKTNNTITKKSFENPGAGPYFRIISGDGKPLIEFRYTFQLEHSINVIVSRGLFKNKSQDIGIYSISLDITFFKDQYSK